MGNEPRTTTAEGDRVPAAPGCSRPYFSVVFEKSVCDQGISSYSLMRPHIAAHGATHLLVDGVSPADSEDWHLEKFGIEVLTEPEWTYDPIPEVRRPLSLSEPGVERAELFDGERGCCRRDSRFPGRTAT